MSPKRQIKHLKNLSEDRKGSNDGDINVDDVGILNVDNNADNDNNNT